MEEDKYSVLMSVYIKESADRLRTAMNSIWDQTISTDDFVLVCDGPLSEDLNNVIYDMQSEHHNTLHVVRLEKNMGLGIALNTGLKECKHDLVARMDSDDISRPYRCEKQLEVFRLNPELSICSGTIEEFSTSIDIIEARRCLPETHDQIIDFAKKRNPFNHPCVMYKKSSVAAADGYKDFYLLEDYFLWIRMLKRGCVGYNLQLPLLWMRAGSEMYKRRAGLKYAKSQKALFKYMRDCGFISTYRYVVSTFMRFASSIMPNVIRKYTYKKVLRKVKGN